MSNHFGPSPNGPYPSEMRTQLWPLCCGARIISGFKAVQNTSEDELVEQINTTLKMVPDHQVYKGETIIPRLTFLTLNQSQMSSEKIMRAIEKAGFKKFAEGAPRYAQQGFFVRDESNTFKVIA